MYTCTGSDRLWVHTFSGLCRLGHQTLIVRAGLAEPLWPLGEFVVIRGRACRSARRTWWKTASLGTELRLLFTTFHFHVRCKYLFAIDTLDGPRFARLTDPFWHLFENVLIFCRAFRPTLWTWGKSACLGRILRLLTFDVS